MFVDSHAHLQMPQYKDDLDRVIERSKEEGIEGIMLVGSNEEDSRAGVMLAKKHDFLYASIGIHPHDVKSVNVSTYERLKELAKEPKVYAYGEIGLDFFKNYSPREIQVKHFSYQIDMADDLSLPIIVHIRDAYDECYDILFKRKEKLRKRGVIHCYSSDFAHAEKFIDLGFYISFSGTITYKRSSPLIETIKNIMTESILIETDAPYLSPVPYRGKRNEPWYVKEVAKTIAEIKQLSLEDVARVTKRNFYDLFNIDKADDFKTEIVYKIRNSLYINLTNRCTNACEFCARSRSYVVKGHDLKLDSEPSDQEVMHLIGDPKEYDEVVFCGYGEPFVRLDSIISISKYIKENGGKVRINTNGQGNLIYKRDVVKELSGLVDAISVSLNAENADKYNEICHSIFGENAYNEMKHFVLKAKEVIPKVTVTVVDMPGINVEECRRIAEKELKVDFKVRKLNMVG